MKQGGISPIGQFLRYLVPLLLSMVLMAVYTFTDTFVVGRKLGAVALGAMGICTPVVTLAYAVGFMFGMGGGSLFSIALGRGDEKKANSFFTTSVTVSLALGIAAAVALNFALSPFAFFLGADESNIGFVLPYLRNAGHPALGMAVIVFGTLSNVALDFLFVFGFGWDMFGAAFATCLCSFMGTAIGVVFTYALKMPITLRPKNLRLSLTARIVKNGVSTSCSEASSGIVTFVFIQQAARLYGTEGPSVYTIIMNWSLIFINLMIGVSEAAQPLVSLNCGAGNSALVRKFRNYALRTSFALGAAYLALGWLCTNALVGVFASDSPEVTAWTFGAFRLYAPAYLLMAAGIAVGLYFQALGDAVPAGDIVFMRGVALPVLLALALPAAFGTTGLWLAMPAAEAVTALTAAVWLSRRERRNAVKMRTDM